MNKKGSETEDFCLIETPKEARLSKFERLTLTGGEELERALDMIGQQFASIATQVRSIQFDLSHISRAAEFYSRSEWRKNPATFFDPPQAPPAVTAVPVHGLKEGRIEDLSFESHFSSHAPSPHDPPENRTVHARLWRHNQAPRGTIIAVHGWSMGDQRLNSLAFFPGTFFRMGLNVALFELPFHGRRKPADQKDGALFPSTDLIRTNEALAQSISDLRELRLYLQTLNSAPVGCMGMSLGAYVSALWASLDPLHFCIPIVPFVSMSEMAWGIIRKHPEFRRYQAAGLTHETLDSIYAVHSPLGLKLQVAKDHVLIIAGIGDQVIPPRQTKLLWDHWKRPRMVWFGGGHAAQLKRREALAEILRFVDGVV
ncbi:MAG: alpha/beta hydrolase family protein [Oligoflexia bacterium]|nr:alpha/beta hydrolase family protein [Oligoflexia bacterium]